MTKTSDQKVSTLQEWIRDGWRYLADASLTSIERRKIRNGMRAAEIALCAGLKLIADQQRAARGAKDCACCGSTKISNRLA